MSKNQRKKEQEAKQILLDIKTDFGRIESTLVDKKLKEMLAKIKS